MTTPNPNQVGNDPMSKPIRQLNDADMRYSGKYMASQIATELVIYGIVLALCTTIGAVIWVGAWFLVLLAPIGAVIWYYFKKLNSKKLNAKP